MTEFTEIEGLARCTAQSVTVAGLDRQERAVLPGQPRRTLLSFEVRVCPKRIISPSVFWFSLKCDLWFQFLSRQLTTICKRPSQVQ